MDILALAALVLAGSLCGSATCFFMSLFRKDDIQSDVSEKVLSRYDALLPGENRLTA